MKKINPTKLLSLAMLLMLFATAMPTLAQEDIVAEKLSAGDDAAMHPKSVAIPISALTKDGDFYLIGSLAEYEAFHKLVATGNPYANAKLTNNISVYSSIGTGDVQFHYRGTFDGQGYTIKIEEHNCTADSLACGLFQYTEPGCVIKNLKVAGAINCSDAKHVGSLIGCATGTKIENCVSDATVNYGGTGCVGGFVGISKGETFFENCAYKGKLNAPTAKACYGFVGKNVHMVSLKSNFVKAIFNVSNDTKTGQFMEVSRENSQTILNNYACHDVWAGDVEPTDNIVDAPNGFADSISIRGKKEVMVESVYTYDFKRACYELNVNGRNGVVWYLDGSYTPSPFKDDYSSMALKKDDGEISIYSSCREHSYEGNICQHCGAIEQGCSIEPLQKRNMIVSNKVTIGYLNYKLNIDKGLSTAELQGYSDGINAAHIPDSINVDGKKYRVDYLADKAFKNSKIEYLYIGKGVNHICSNVFNGCDKLKYVHIADGPDNGNAEDRLLTEENEEDNKPLFYACPLETIYIGRNLRWYTDSWGGTFSPFQSPYTFGFDKCYDKVFFGPLVTRVGNYYYDDPTKGFYDELFDDSRIIEYYFMGDDSCLDKKLLIGCTEGFELSTKAYINRTFDDNEKFIGNIQISDQSEVLLSIYDFLNEITYGPYVKKIVNNSFSRPDGMEWMPKFVDFTNAFNLEEIEYEAFQDCDLTFFKGTFENTKLKKIGNKAFYDCDNLRKIVIPGTVTEIGDKAFNDIDGISLTLAYSDQTLTIGEEAFYTSSFEDNFASIYLARKLAYKKDCPFKSHKLLGTLVIAPEITELPKGLFKNFPKLGALTLAHSDTPLQLKGGFEEIFYFEDGIASMFIDREIKDYDGKNYCSSWGNTVRGSLKELTINVKDSKNVYENFKALKTVMFGANVETVSGSFPNCTALNTIFAMGNINIKDNIFAGSTSLENVFLMGDKLMVGKDAFAGCNNIKQVVVGLTKDPENNQGSSDAFTDNAYENAKLSCAGDTNNKTVEFTKEPWKSFLKREVLIPCHDYENGKPYNTGIYDHARIDHHFDNGKYELVYLPFDMDSYSFGADAEIYKTSGGIYYSDTEVENNYNKLNIYFEKLNFDEEKTLRRNSFYIVNTKHNIESLESHPNLFEQSKIQVDNTRNEYLSYNNPMLIVANEEDKTLDVDDYAYIYQDGVVKRVDNEVSTIPNGVTLYKNETTDDGKELVINFIDNKKNLLISSKADLGFSQYLEGYSSFYDADYTYKAPEWCEIYVVTERKSDGSLTMQEIEDRIINKRQAVLVKSKDGVPDGLKEYLTHTTKESTDPLYNDNLLRGVSVATPANELADEGFVYVLSCNSQYQNTGFYKLSGNRLMPAGKAYLSPGDLSPEQLAKTCLFVLNDNTVTGVEHAAAGADANDNIYDVMGRSLKQAGFKGIYIINGKKVVVK